MYAQRPKKYPANIGNRMQLKRMRISQFTDKLCGGLWQADTSPSVPTSTGTRTSVDRAAAAAAVRIFTFSLSLYESLLIYILLMLTSFLRYKVIRPGASAWTPIKFSISCYISLFCVILLFIFICVRYLPSIYLYTLLLLWQNAYKLRWKHFCFLNLPTFFFIYFYLRSTYLKTCRSITFIFATYWAYHTNYFLSLYVISSYTVILSINLIVSRLTTSLAGRQFNVIWYMNQMDCLKILPD